MSRVRLLLADEQRLCLSALEKLLSDEVDIVATAGTSRDLLSGVERLKPAVVLVRMSESNSGWFQVLKKISRGFPDTKIVVLASEPNRSFSDKALSCGASVCVPATDDTENLLQAIRHAAATVNGTQIGPSGTSERLTLSARQIEILRLIVLGLPQKAIAAELHISPKTVEFHKYRMMKQLGVTNSADLIVAGIKMGLREDVSGKT